MSLTLLDGTACSVSQNFSATSDSIYELAFDFSALSHGDNNVAHLGTALVFPRKQPSLDSPFIRGIAQIKGWSP